jgi:hypothetical protein
MTCKPGAPDSQDGLLALAIPHSGCVLVLYSTKPYILIVSIMDAHLVLFVL